MRAVYASGLCELEPLRETLCVQALRDLKQLELVNGINEWFAEWHRARPHQIRQVIARLLFARRRVAKTKRLFGRERGSKLLIQMRTGSRIRR